mmetsp:Transcript_44829/g.143598  ORF Transcript_44829/g.143598 Transcript_44829/m.143598 type:complete len:195 (+) Transcript_44829:70-654(+)
MPSLFTKFFAATALCALSALSEDPMMLDDACLLGDDACGLELLQRRAGVARTAGVAEDAPDTSPGVSGCVEGVLSGDWLNQDALGFITVNVRLHVYPPGPDSDYCDSINADLIMPSYLGAPVRYNATFLDPVANSTYKVKYYTPLANPPYYHEGTFDLATETLTEDLGMLNGETPLPPIAGASTSILTLKRVSR